eukprot:6103892-Ditylum_brightwellii.AAC.1
MHVVGNEENDVDDDVDNNVDDSVEDSDEDSVDSADKHLTHLSQAVDCYSTWRSEQNKHVDGKQDNDVVDDDDVDNGADNN